MRFTNQVSVAVLALFIVAASAKEGSANPLCAQDHCSKISEKMNKFCKDNGMGGKPFLVFGPDGNECYCPCSCMASNTLLSVADSPFFLEVEKVAIGENILSPYSKRNQNTVDKVLKSDFTDVSGKVHQIKFSNGSELTVSSDHTFVAPDFRVVAAEQLEKGHSVLSSDHSETTVVEHIENRNFRGTLMNVIVNEKSKKAKNHFIVTNSIVSGDWLMQSNHAIYKAEIDARLGLIETFQDSDSQSVNNR